LTRYWEHYYSCIKRTLLLSPFENILYIASENCRCHKYFFVCRQLKTNKSIKNASILPVFGITFHRHSIIPTNMLWSVHCYGRYGVDVKCGEASYKCHRRLYCSRAKEITEIERVCLQFINQHFIHFSNSSLVHEYESKNVDALTSGVNHIANPVNAFLMIKRLTSDWGQVERLMRTNMAEGCVKLFINYYYETYFRFSGQHYKSQNA
jgi:hypothetical protein